MTTKKQKRERGIARREAEEAERRERGLHFLSLAQADRAEQRKKSEEDRKQRAIAKSKRLARAHEAAKASKPGEHKTADTVMTRQQKKGSGRRNKQYQKARGKTQEAT